MMLNVQEAFLTGFLFIFIFGGGYFVLTLIRFSIEQARMRAWERRYQASILANAQRHFINERF